ncbi:MAG: sigma-70 family RNA polymerase sigma factor [Gemmataceae bacterium]|nr:sigma-70 family RNA polymerase sigma factor [Gemmataceae bacterium]
MSDAKLDTVHLHQCIVRWQAGDRAAADEILQATGIRLERPARKMLGDFPNVHAWADTLDVLQGSLLRLLHTLQNLQPASTRDFFNLAVVHIRRELLDLARQCAGRQAILLNKPARTGENPADCLAQVPDPSASPQNLEVWCEFHEAVEHLPAEEREVVGLVFYQGLTQAQVATLCGVSARTVRRRWTSACARLHDALDGRFPEAVP